MPLRILALTCNHFLSLVRRPCTKKVLSFGETSTREQHRFLLGVGMNALVPRPSCLLKSGIIHPISHQIVPQQILDASNAVSDRQ